jgi:putative Mg2+ transporter-C (MgtC) family protein
VDGTADLILRLVVACAAGATLGFEREVRNHAAGIRTHALVALGSALFTIAGAYGFEDLARAPSIDPARVAAQVASGIGFIGAGAIIRNGLAVRGLSTAATLWLGAALGLAAGAGLFSVVAAATVLILAILVGLQLLEGLAARLSPAQGMLEVRYARGHGTLGPLMRSLESANAHIVGLQVDDDDATAREPGVRVVSVRMTLDDKGQLERIARSLQARPEVEQVDWSDGSLVGVGSVRGTL